MAIKQCSKCHIQFECTSPVAGCWCELYSLTPSSLVQLKDNYADCLCPVCLAGFAENPGMSEPAATNEE